ncbi:MAG: hypothetical protein CMJ31_03420 [Phycisphaerae bacterium]|nr:hypothetical protein [Phycisphaerae bacterium]
MKTTAAIVAIAAASAAAFAGSTRIQVDSTTQNPGSGFQGQGNLEGYITAFSAPGTNAVSEYNLGGAEYRGGSAFSPSRLVNDAINLFFVDHGGGDLSLFFVANDGIGGNQHSTVTGNVMFNHDATLEVQDDFNQDSGLGERTNDGIQTCDVGDVLAAHTSFGIDFSWTQENTDGFATSFENVYGSWVRFSDLVGDSDAVAITNYVVHSADGSTIAGSFGDFNNLQMTVVPTPTSALLGSAGLGLLVTRRRRA